MVYFIVEMLELVLLVWLALRAGLARPDVSAQTPPPPQEDVEEEVHDVTDGIVNLMSYSVNVKPRKEDDA